MIGIYKITSPSGKIYIGQSININQRKDFHASPSSLGKSKLYNSVRKYGWKNHIFEVIEECEETNLNERERYWQEHYNCIEDGLNCRLTTTDTKSGKISDETKRKMSQAAIGRKMSKESRLKLSKAKQGKPGRIPSKEEIQKLIERNKKPRSKEFRENMSRAIKESIAKKKLILLT